MRIGEPLLGFLGRINGLVNELLGTGEKVDEKSRMVIIASKLRPALKEAAEDKMERSPELTYEGLVAYPSRRVRGTVLQNWCTWLRELGEDRAEGVGEEEAMALDAERGT